MFQVLSIKRLPHSHEWCPLLFVKSWVRPFSPVAWLLSFFIFFAIFDSLRDLEVFNLVVILFVHTVQKLQLIICILSKLLGFQTTKALLVRLWRCLWLLIALKYLTFLWQVQIVLGLRDLVDWVWQRRTPFRDMRRFFRLIGVIEWHKSLKCCVEAIKWHVVVCVVKVYSRG